VGKVCISANSPIRSALVKPGSGTISWTTLARKADLHPKGKQPEM